MQGSFVKRFISSVFKFSAALIFLSLQNTQFFAQSSPITFSEVMFNPSETNGEFVEIFNTSLTDTIDLAGFKFKYHTSSNNSLVVIQGGTLLPPGSYAVILQGAYDFDNGLYKTLIPAGNIILKTSGNNFGSSGMANTTSREVFLINSTGDTVDTYTYSADNISGHSDEKVVMTKDNSSSNWGNSTSLHGTPGYKNSVSPPDYDLKIKFNAQSPLQPFAGDSVIVTIVVLNNGINNAQNFVVNFYDDTNSDSISQNDELLFANNYVLLTNGDSIVISKNIHADAAAVYSFIAEVIYTLDENNTNNKSILRFDVSEKPAEPFEIIINEFMYSPPPDQPEWIEIYNNSNRSFNLKKWKVGDNSSLVELTSGDIFLNPQEYLVISDEASITDFYPVISKLIIKPLPSLNNTGDEIRIKNEIGTTIDSIKYFSSWGGPGKSLERISKDIPGNEQSSWKSSIASLNGTPGSDNSVSQKNYDVCIKILSAPLNPFVGDYINVKVSVKNIGKSAAQNIIVNLYDDANNDLTAQQYEKYISKNVNDLNAGDSAAVDFLFSIYSLRVYNLIAEVVCTPDENPYNNNDFIKISPIESPAALHDVVINEFNYAPSSGEPEWIEIFNRSGKSINIKDWCIGNDGAFVIITGSDLYINPNEYVVISRSSSINKLYKINSQLIVKSFPSLDNKSGEIILKNNFSGIVDEVVYTSDWGGGEGNSIERININNKSSDETNWKTNDSRFNGTPGRINSVSTKKHDLLVAANTTKNNYAEAGTPIDIIVTITNLGSEIASGFSLIIYNDKNKNNLRDDNEILHENSDLQLDAGNIYEYVFSIENLGIGKNAVYAFTKYDKDEYNDNDTADVLLHIVKINEVRGDVVINEIMYAPDSPEPEWIEIYNRSEKEIDLQGYCIADEASKNEIVSNKLIIKPNEYFVFAKDSSIFSVYPEINHAFIVNLPSLNNSHDQIVLIDSLGRVIDSVKYNSTWGGNPGKSLERVEPGLSSTDSINWKNPDVHVKSSPSRTNSVSPKEYDVAITGFFTIPHTPHYGEDVTAVIEVDNYGKQDAVFTVVLYELTEANTQEIKEQTSQLRIAAGSFLEYSFMHKISAINSVHTFEAEILFEADEFNYNNKKAICIAPACLPYKVLLNEIMYNPVNGEPEWIELYNNTNYNIDLSNWSITDLLTKPISTKINDGVILSKSYMVITKDSSITEYHKTIPSGITINKFANLNNDEDGIVIKDCYGNMIDSIHYTKSWGGENGKSIERKNLDSASSLRSNWASSTDIELSTPGRINSVSQKEYDLQITKIYCIDKYVEYGKPAIVCVDIKNIGINNAVQFSIKLFKNFNNGYEEPSELINQKEINNLPSGDSLLIEFNFSEYDVGKNNLCAIIDFTADQNKDNNSGCCDFQCAVINEIYNDIVINEIMYAPDLPEPEWIEIYNRSEKEINLQGYCIADDASKNEIVSNKLIIKPNEYFVFAKDSLIFSVYPEINHAFIVNLPSFSNSHDQIVLIDSLGRVIDSVKYSSSWCGNPGKSLERVEPGLSSTDSTNWNNPDVHVKATPSKINSVSKKNYDAAVTGIIINPLRAFYGSDVSIAAEICNYGNKDVLCMVYLYELNEMNSKELKDHSQQLKMPASGKLKYRFAYNIIAINSKHSFIVEVVLDVDEFNFNNTLAFEIYPGCAAGDVLLNEIMYNPVNGEPEWIELYNNTEYNIDLSNWSVTDLLTKPTSTKISNGLILPKSYQVISKDSNIIDYHQTITSSLIINKFANLNNDEDGMVIKDCYGNTIDSVHYNKSWGGENGKSIERKNLDSASSEKSNWTSSTDIELSTPGRINSVSQKEYDLQITDFYYENEFVEFGKTAIINVVVQNVGKNQAEHFKVKLYKKYGGINSEIKELISIKEMHNLPGGDSVNVKYEANDLAKGKNYFYVVAEYELDQNEQNNYAYMNVECIELNETYNDIVINEIMYAPVSPEPEWIEIYNRSEKEINLRGYFISDNADKNKVVHDSLIIKSGEYYVFAKDSSIHSFYEGLTNIILTNFQSLSNSGDIIVLSDSLGRIIDSVKYKSSWGGISGRSLERVSVNIPSNDSTNWKSSNVKIGGTPSKINSVSKKSYDAAINGILFNPPRPAIGSNVNISAEIENTGFNEISFQLFLYEIKKDGERFNLEKSGKINLIPGEKKAYMFNYAENPLTGSRKYLAEIISPYDEDSLNNIVCSSISPEYKYGDVKVNEIMYNPFNGEPEWFELYNDLQYEIDLSGWTISDVLTNPTAVTIINAVVGPKSFTVIAKDSSIINYHKEIFSFSVNNFANLNNDEDGIIVKDCWGNTIDSVFYNKTWGGLNGKSLERISFKDSSASKKNWSSSVNIELSTPGRINSVSIKEYDVKIASVKTLWQNNNNEDELIIITCVRNIGEKIIEDLVLEIYSDESGGLKIEDSILINSINAGDSIEITSTEIKYYEGKKILCKINCPYDQDLSNNVFETILNAGHKRNEIVISEIMYNPFDGESEWIEIVNNSGRIINLKNWFVSDIVSAVKAIIAEEDSFLGLNEFAIITRDSNAFPFYPPINFYESKFGSLGNTYDGIIIYDNSNNVIDSVEYNSHWGGKKGCSLERCNYNQNGCDSTNWSTTLCREGATPGVKNTVSQLCCYKRGDIIINEILYNPTDNNCEFLEIYNASEDSVELGGMHFKIGLNQYSFISPVLHKIPSKSFAVISRDSSLVNNYSYILNNTSMLLVNNNVSLPNEGAVIVLSDAKGNVLDSLFYSSSWNNKSIPSTKNKSLERISPYLDSNDPKNWSTCVCFEGATPGQQNSLFIDEIISEKKVTISPNPFSPDNDGFEDFAAINLTLPYKLSQVRIKIFDSLGRQVRTLTHNASSAAKSIIIFDGLDDSGRALRIGIYILLIEIISSSGNIETIKTPIVIARKL